MLVDLPNEKLEKLLILLEECPIGSIHLGNKDREVDLPNKKMEELLARLKGHKKKITSLELFNVHNFTSLPANKFPHLSRLSFYQCPQFHFDSLIDLPLLASLSIRDDRADLSLSLSPSLTGLKCLAIESSSLQSFEIPEELTQLKTIKLTCSALTQLTMPPLPNLKCLDISGCTNLEAIEKFPIYLYSMNLLKEILLKGCNQNLINYFKEYLPTDEWKHWPSKEKFVKKSYFMSLPKTVSLEPLEKVLKPNMYEEVVGFYGSRPLVCREKLHGKIFSYLGSPMLKLLNKESSKNKYALFDVIIDSKAKLEQLLKRDGKLNARSLQVNRRSSFRQQKFICSFPKTRG